MGQVRGPRPRLTRCLHVAPVCQSFRSRPACCRGRRIWLMSCPSASNRVLYCHHNTVSHRLRHLEEHLGCILTTLTVIRLPNSSPALDAAPLPRLPYSSRPKAMILGEFRDQLEVRRRRHTGSISTPRGPSERNKAALTAIETIRGARTISCWATGTSTTTWQSQPGITPRRKRSAAQARASPAYLLRRHLGTQFAGSHEG